MSRVRIEILDGHFEDDPTFTSESSVEVEGAEPLLRLLDRAYRMMAAACPTPPPQSEFVIHFNASAPGTSILFNDPELEPNDE